jgi:hypothetical protein
MLLVLEITELTADFLCMFRTCFTHASKIVRKPTEQHTHSFRALASSVKQKKPVYYQI